MLSRIMLRMLRLLLVPPEEEEWDETKAWKKECMASAWAVSPTEMICAVLNMLATMPPEEHRQEVELMELVSSSLPQRYICIVPSSTG